MRIKLLNVFAASITLAVLLIGCQKDGNKVDLGERYDSDIVHKSGETVMIGADRYAEIFYEYSKTASETEFVIHERTAITIAEAVMQELYPDDNYGAVYLPIYFRPTYYKKGNCWEVWLHKGALGKTLSTSEQNSADVMFVYIDVNSGAVKAIIPSFEFLADNQENS